LELITWDLVRLKPVATGDLRFVADPLGIGGARERI